MLSRPPSTTSTRASSGRGFPSKKKSTSIAQLGQQAPPQMHQQLEGLQKIVQQSNERRNFFGRALKEATLAPKTAQLDSQQIRLPPSGS